MLVQWGASFRGSFSPSHREEARHFTQSEPGSKSVFQIDPFDLAVLSSHIQMNSTKSIQGRFHYLSDGSMRGSLKGPIRGRGNLKTFEGKLQSFMVMLFHLRAFGVENRWQLQPRTKNIIF